MDTNHNHNNLRMVKPRAGRSPRHNKQKLFNQGSYGCTWTPGLSCKGKTSRATSYINKIQKVDFSSQNEAKISELIKQIPLYKKMFAPVKTKCTLKFNQIINSNLDTNECKIINDYKDKILYNPAKETKMLDKNFVMFYIKFIKGDIISKLFYNINNDTFYSIYITIFFYLINSIKILNNNHISHNDLHSSNIMYDNIKNRPIIIDFGFSFHIANFYKHKNIKTIHYDNIYNYFYDYREDNDKHPNYRYLTEKRFVSFCVYNHTSIFKNVVDDDLSLNNLNKRAVDFFINDTYYSFRNRIDYIFNEDELIEYKNALKKFYSKFLDKNKYKYFSDIIHELLPHILQYNDLHSLVINFIEINHHHPIGQNHDYKYRFIFRLFRQIFKKILYPDPLQRINSCQLISIITFIVYYFNNVDFKNDTHDNYFNIFYQKIKILFSEIDIDFKIFFNKKYAFVDFQRYFSPDNIKLFQELNINLRIPI